MAVTESLVNTYTESDALDLARLVKQGEVTPVELVEAAVTCIERLNPVVHKRYDLGREAAASADHNALFADLPFRCTTCRPLCLSRVIMLSEFQLSQFQ
ncbi:hypothetical protein ID850_02870 [Xenorhabdus sp. Flor]|uniref:hypothetical protein n=1 Tax=Xenorhabdus cabanillasii TaxID=351673 RepID=UPI0019C178CA|nr:hypothetical protein [Xenorhabdus sp. Flor]MBD2813728.1 hypothetical protein [Xenorhabdus sp. Flor]